MTISAPATVLDVFLDVVHCDKLPTAKLPGLSVLVNDGRRKVSVTSDEGNVYLDGELFDLSLQKLALLHPNIALELCSHNAFPQSWVEYCKNGNKTIPLGGIVFTDQDPDEPSWYVNALMYHDGRLAFTYIRLVHASSMWITLPPELWR